jgi:hypothetical protein
MDYFVQRARLSCSNIANNEDVSLLLRSISISEGNLGVDFLNHFNTVPN